jgi:hypothetical protein
MMPATKRLEYLSRAAVVAVAVALLAGLWAMVGCVSMEAPKTFNERLAYGYASVATARNTAASMLERKRISKESAVQVQALADQARTGLDLARGTAGKGDILTAEGQLTLALDVLTRLEAYLRTQEAK